MSGITEVWIAAGLRKTWRVASWYTSFGEFMDEADARELLRLLLKGNPEMVDRAALTEVGRV